MQHKTVGHDKPRLSFWQIWNMSFGFLGIQFGWGLQIANMSPIYKYLGAEESNISYLWLAGPITGLLVQPIIGSMSDRTWNRLGRRRPYFLVGAILASITLFFMPNSSTVWMAAGLLWILDASINITMEPFRAFVADKLPEEQRTVGFVMQSFFIGIGQTLANALPYIFTALGLVGVMASGIPLSVEYAFKIGAVVFLIAVLWTVLMSKEYPPEDIEAFERMKREKKGVLAGFAEIFSSVAEMPKTMKQLAVVQFFTWFALPCMWQFFGLAIARHVFFAPDEKSPLFKDGTEWGGLCFAVYNIVCFVIAFLLPWLANKTSRKAIHAISLICGGLGLLSVFFIQNKWMLFLSMAGVGIAWSSILSMPYVILSSAIPAARMGVYMGVFNLFIVIPQVVMSFVVPSIFKNLLRGDPLYAVALGGLSMLLAAATVMIVDDKMRRVPVDEVIRGDEHELLTVQQSAQPVPSTGLIDEK
ncbi:MAG TPA: MFS transporter [Pyrinomonadaceae bacterium]|jgi:maltose/moltooligosaccharide transporter|nr:MFS transporter [Pyrinomonadaceae bacterium]